LGQYELVLGHDWTRHVRSSLGAALRNSIVAIYIELQTVFKVKLNEVDKPDPISAAIEKCGESKV
jgi:hypothetical protein